MTPDPVLEALNRAAEELTPQDIDLIIAHLRSTRRDFESGVKPKKESVDLVSQIKPKKIEGFVRRF